MNLLLVFACISQRSSYAIIRLQVNVCALLSAAPCLSLSVSKSHELQTSHFCCGPCYLINTYSRLKTFKNVTVTAAFQRDAAAGRRRPRQSRERGRRARSRPPRQETEMKSRVLLLAVLLAAVCFADAEKRRRHRRIKTTSTTTAAPRPDEREDTESEHLELGMAERMDERRFQEAEKARVLELMAAGGESGNEVFLDDPCLKVHCSAGRVCELDEHGDAQCACIKDCPYETDSRRKVCTNHNETWASDCEVYRQRCLCLDNSELCRGTQYHHLQIEYYGACRDMPACAAGEMADFPRRMRDWLFNIMRDMAERRELSPHYQRLEREAEANLTRRWTNAAVWKWCDLDAHDNDRFVSRHELFPIRAPLMALEHCIAPFLDRCDADDDHRITLAEWGRCLELDEYELEDRCDEFTDDSS